MRHTPQGGSKATTRARATRSRCNKTSSTKGIRPTAEGHVLTARKRMSQTLAMVATTRNRKKRKNQPLGFFSKQWLEQYNMDNPVNLNEYPRVEF